VKRTDKRVLQVLYDEIASKFSARDNVVLEEHLSARILKCFRRAPGGRVLDLGCGNGKSFPLFYDSGAGLVGVDFSLGMLRKARRLHEGKLDARLVRGDIEMLPFRDGAFDLVFSTGVLGEYAPVDRGVREAARILRPGGVFTFTFMNLLTPYRIWKSARIGAIRFLFGTDLTAYKLAGGRMVARFPATPGYVQARVRQAGFRDIEMENLADVRAHYMVTCVKR